MTEMVGLTCRVGAHNSRYAHDTRLYPMSVWLRSRFCDASVFRAFALPCLGPLVPRRAVGARHDGLPRQFSPLLPVVCHGLSLSEGFAGPLRDVVDPALFRPASSSTAFDCSL